MKKGISFSYEERGPYIVRECLKNGKIDPKYRMPVVYLKSTILYQHPFLSWDNFTYAIAERNKEELDDYLLFHALQENRKTSISAYTKKYEELEKQFSGDYNLCCIKRDDGFTQAFVCRKGSLNDYFDGDELEEYYDSQRVDYNDGLFDMLFNAEMIDLVSGRVWLRSDIPYSPIMMMDGSDGVAGEFGAAGGLIAGLFFGYPVESSISMVKSNPAFFR